METLSVISKRTGVPYSSLRKWVLSGKIAAHFSGSTWLSSVAAVKSAYDSHKIHTRQPPNFEEATDEQG